MPLTRITLFLILVTLLSFSCKKEEGEGGTSTITGKVLVKKYNSDYTIKLGEYYAPDVDVYIIYGDDSIYSDDFKTGIDGWYRFEYLQKGSYTIYALSKDSTRMSISNKIPVMKTVEIKENNSTVVVDDLVIFN